MKKTRANGEGYIGKRIIHGVQKGWRASILIGYNEDGKPIRKQFCGKTQKDVKEKLESFKVNQNLGIIPSDDKITLEGWYFTWLFEYKLKILKPTSFERYENTFRNYIKNTNIGKMKLKDLRANHLQMYYNYLIDKKNISVSTIKGINEKLSSSLSDAEKQGYVQKNYCRFVTLPKEERTNKKNVLSYDEQVKFIESIKGHKFELLFLLALSTGLRRGEILGLKWSDIDFNNHTLTVNRTLQRHPIITKDGKEKNIYSELLPKTKNSHRVIPILSQLIPKLESHKIEQNINRLKFGELYLNKDYVFCNEIGKHLDDKIPCRNLQSISKKLGIPYITFHGLRHTFATRLFEADVAAKTVQMFMGHSEIQTTLDIYTKVMPEKKFEEIEKISSCFVF